MAITKPELEGVGGFGFAADQTARPDRVDTSAIGLLDKVSSFANQFIKQRSAPNEEAFMQGMVDKVGNTVQEQSIFTPDSYQQGVRYAEVTDELSAGTTGLYQEGIAAAADGTPESAARYKQKVSELVAQMNRSVKEKGLSGEPLHMAQKQILTTATNAMITYQKEFDLQAQRKINAANATESNTMLVNIKGAQYDSGAVTTFVQGKFDSARLRAEQNKDDKDPISTAGKQVVEAINQDLDIANPQTAEGQRIVQAWHQYAQTDAAKALGTAYADLSAKVTTKVKEVQGHNAAVIGMTQSELRRQVDSDQSPVTRDGYMQLRNDIYNKVNTAMIDSSAAKTLLDDLAGIEAKQFKDEANNAALLSPDRATRLAFGGTGADKEAVNLWYKRFAGAYPNDAERMAAMVEYGVQSTNPDMVTAGTKEILPAIENMLLMPPDKFDTTATVQQKQVWSSFVGAYNRAKLTSPGLANKMMDAFSPDMRAAVDEIIDAPYTGRNVGADMKTIQAVMEQRRATVAGGGFAGSVTSNFSFTPDMVSSSMWGRFAPNWLGGESDSIRAKNFWLQPNDAGAQYITGQLNLAMQGGAKDYLLKQERQGRLINSPSQIVSALKDGKYILPLETGVANINPTWYSKVADGYKARFNYGLNDETVSAAVSALQDQYFQKFNGKDGRDFDREDVQATVVGDILMVKAYKNGAALPFETQKWGVSMVHEAAYNVLKRRADVAAPPITGSVMYGKQSMDLTPDWDRTFTGGLKQHIAQSLLKHEGTTMKVHTPDKNRPNIQTIGMGINLTGNLANEPLRKAVVAAHATGDKRKIDAATGAFIADYYKGFPKLVASAGLPPMEKSNVVNGTPAYVALANAHYQSPLAGQEYAKLLSIAKTDPAKAKQMFRTSAAYKDIDSASNGKAEKSDRVRLYDAGFDAMKRVNAVDGWYTRNFNKPLVSMLPKASDFNLPMR